MFPTAKTSPADLAVSAVVLAPGLHHERVIDGDTENLLHALPLQLGRGGHVAGEVGGAAAGREGARHSEDDYLRRGWDWGNAGRS